MLKGLNSFQLHTVPSPDRTCFRFLFAMNRFWYSIPWWRWDILESATKSISRNFFSCEIFWICCNFTEVTSVGSFESAQKQRLNGSPDQRSSGKMFVQRWHGTHFIINRKSTRLWFSATFNVSWRWLSLSTHRACSILSLRLIKYITFFLGAKRCVGICWSYASLLTEKYGMAMTRMFGVFEEFASESSFNQLNLCFRTNADELDGAIP